MDSADLRRRDRPHLPRLVVCGAGALGGNLVEHLARSALPAALVVIDHDRVEAANVVRDRCTWAGADRDT